MSAIRTAIELQDNFTGVLYQVINSVNLGLSAMEDLHQAMNAPVDAASIEAARDSINQATIAVQQLDAAIQGMETPTIETPTVPQNSAPAALPVQPDVPVHWQSDSLEVFTNSGVKRFEQEVQSANNMLNTLNQTQSKIAQTAAQTDLFPANAVADINHMQNRLQAIQQRIQTIENNPLNMGTDTANAELERLRAQMSQVLNIQNELSAAMQNMDVSTANDAYLRLSQIVSGTERYIRDNVDEQGRFNREIQKGTQQASDLTDTIKNAVLAYVSIQSLGKVLNISDELVQTASRLNMMNDDLQSTQDLLNMVYLSAQNARGSFSEMTNVVARFGNNAGDAFGSSAEVVAFAELVQKQMTIAGASTQETSNAILQLSQALGSGVLRGDELNSIFEQAPNLIRNIADYIEQNDALLDSVANGLKMKSEDLKGDVMGHIRDIASQGMLSADIVKASVFSAADEINANMESMPMTWEQIWQSFQNTALIAFQPVLERINDIANRQEFQGFVNSAIEGMAILSNAILNIFDLAGAAGGFLADHWSLISPLIYGVAAALAVYYGWQMLSAAAATAQAVAEGALNAVLSANPTMKIVLATIALIAVIMTLCNWIASMSGVAATGFGLLCGVTATAAAFLLNVAIGLFNAVLQAAWTIFVEPFLGLVEFALNAANGGFDSFGGAVANLIGQIIGWFLSLGKVVTKIIDAIFGTDWTAGLSSLQKEVTAWGKNETAITLDRTAPAIDFRIDYGEAFDAGSTWGDGIADKLSQFQLSDLFGATNLPNPEDYTDILYQTDDYLSNIADNTSSMTDSLDMTKEELRYLRDIAEQERVNHFTTAEINIEQTNHNTVSGKMDLDGVVSGLTDAVNEAVDMITEGVHES